MAFDIVAELFVNNSWTAVTGDVRQSEGVTITRGRDRETTGVSTVDHATCRLMLDNRSGNYSPRNPVGTYYGTIGRNTPIRVCRRLITAAFTSTVSNAWPNADTGETWSTHGAGGTVQASDYNSAAGVGTHSVPVANAYRMTYLATPAFRNVDVSVTWTMAISNITGANVEPGNILLRGQSTSEYYMVRVVVTTAEAITVAIHTAAGVVLAAAVTVTGITHTSGQAVRVRAQVEGQTIRAKVWLASAGEPFDWHVSVTDTTGSQGTASIPDAGWVGVRSGVATGNTNSMPVVFSYDTFEVRSMRFAGEVSSWPPRWDVSGIDGYTSIEAAGILRRLSQGQSPLRSALYRYMTTEATPVAYWALEDGDTATSGKSEVAGVPDLQPFGSAVPVFGRQTGPAGSASLPDFSSKSSLAVRLPSLVDTDEWQMEFWFQTQTGNSDPFTAIVPLQWDMNGTIPAFDILLFVGQGDGGGGVGTIGFDIAAYEASPPSESNRSATTDLAIIYPFIPNVQGQWRNMRVLMQQTNATTVALSFYLDDILYFTKSDTTWTLGVPTFLVVNPTQDTPGSNCYAGVDGVGIASFGHVAIYNTVADSGSYEAGIGYVGETAGRRIERLCSEEGIPFSHIGDLDDTARMGPQRTATLLDLLEACVEADGGSLYESRGTLGLVYRTRWSLYNQAATVTLDLAGGQLSPPFEPTDDDQLTTNDVTATRTGGGRFQLEEDTGRMSTADPQDGGIGRYDIPVQVEVEADSQLPDIAGWLLHLGTVDEARYPRIAVNLARTAITGALSRAVLDLDVDDRLVVTGAEAKHSYNDITQLARGYTEVLNTFEHELVCNTAPESPYQIIILDDTRFKLDSATTTLAAGITSSATSFTVAISDGVLWTTTAGQMPILITIGGEDMSVGAVSGGSSPQTFSSVTRSVNGVVKSHAAGAAVRLTQRPTLGR